MESANEKRMGGFDSAPRRDWTAAPRPGKDAAVTSTPKRGRPVTPHWDATKTSGADAWAQKRRLAAAMRLVIERLVPSNAPEDELRRAADGLERYAEQLRVHPRLKRFHYAESANAGDVGAFFDQSPLIGLANPLAPPITVGQVGERAAEATVTFGSAYEGPPGCVHGGYIAAAFDEVLGFVQSRSGNPGMTGTLTIRYRRPTPLHTELFFEAQILRIEGRKIFTRGRLFAGDEVTAEADGLFISVDRKKMEGLMRRRTKLEATIRAGG
jgi:acyl-coenzyme A thioesterase PaaI-like protein